MLQSLISFFGLDSKLNIVIVENKNYDDFMQLYNAYSNQIDNQPDITLISVKIEYKVDFYFSASGEYIDKSTDIKWFLFYNGYQMVSFL